MKKCFRDDNEIIHWFYSKYVGNMVLKNCFTNLTRSESTKINYYQKCDLRVVIADISLQFDYEGVMRFLDVLLK